MTPPDDYDRLLRRLLERNPKPPLSPAKPFDAALSGVIEGLDLAPAAKAVLHLLNDDLARSHEIAQSSEGVATFDYIHAIVHRREGDFSNSKYWFRQVGSHPVWADVYGSDRTAPARFVDQCRQAGDKPTPELQATQLKELETLLRHVAKGGGV